MSPTIYTELTQHCTKDEVYEWMADVFSNIIRLHIPVDTEMGFDEMVLEIEKRFKLVYGPISYVGRSGQRVTTTDKIRIAPIPIMLLDKIADAWLSIDVGKISNFGVLAVQNRVDKHSSPWKKSTPKTNGETELTGLYVSYGGRELAAELIDRNGSIASQLNISRNILSSPTPTRVDDLLDREKFPLGNARPPQIVQHMFSCSGFRVVYAPEELQ